jgi:small membrane protein
MQWVKVPLILFAVVALIALFRNRQRVELRAGSRVLALILAAAAIASIADPDIPQRTAELLGVGRGTDLLLYVLVVVFTLTSLGLYFRIRESDQRVRKLARALAIERALREEGDNPEIAPTETTEPGGTRPEPAVEAVDPGTSAQPPGV